MGGAARCAPPMQRVAVQQRRDPAPGHHQGRRSRPGAGLPGSAQRRHHQVQDRHQRAARDRRIRARRASRCRRCVDRNFSFALGHEPCGVDREQAAVDRIGAGPERQPRRYRDCSGSRARSAIANLSGARATITVDRDPDSGRLAAASGDGEAVVQDDRDQRVGCRPASLLLVIDGSARLANRTEDLIRALDAIPAGAKVGAIIAAEPMPAPRRRRPGRRRRSRTLVEAPALHRLHRRTGQCSGARRGAAGAGGRAERDAAVDSWPATHQLPGQRCRLEQAAARLSRLPQVILYAVEPGPNELLPDAPWAWGARFAAANERAGNRPRGFLRAHHERSRRPYAIRRTQGQSTEGLRRGSDHIARLWANERVLELMRADPVRNRAAAVALATQYRLVTPVSGAVVLETQQQYDESRLTPVSQATVPTIPEPHEWALALIACAALALVHLAQSATPSGGRVMHPLLIAMTVMAATWNAWWWYFERVGSCARGGGRARPDGGCSSARSGVARVRLPAVAAAGGAAADRALLAAFAASQAFLPPLMRAAIAIAATLFCLHLAAFRERPPFAFWGLVALALPVLPSLQFTLGYPMRIVSAALAVALLQAHGLAVARQGTFLVWRDEMVQFDAPCSGVNMLWAGLLLDPDGMRAAAARRPEGHGRGRAVGRPRDRRQRVARREPVLCRGRPRRAGAGLVARRHRPRGLHAVGRRDPLAARPAPGLRRASHGSREIPGRDRGLSAGRGRRGPRRRCSSAGTTPRWRRAGIFRAGPPDTKATS